MKCFKVPKQSGFPKKTQLYPCADSISTTIYAAYCTKCLKGYYISADTLSCQACSSNCYDCSSGTNCVTCLATFTRTLVATSYICVCNAGSYLYYDAVTKQCQNCGYFMTDCVTCSSSSTCLSCITGSAVVSGNSCAACPSNCTSCSANTLACTACSNPTYSIVSGRCVCT